MKDSYEPPVTEVITFETSGSVLTASNEIIPVTPITPFSVPGDDLFVSPIDDALYF